MYSCRVEKRIWKEPERSSGFTRLYFDLEVEDTPRIGLEVNEGSWYSGPLNFVIWDSDGARFVCRVEDEYPIHERDCGCSHEWLVENFLLQGWQAAES